MQCTMCSVLFLSSFTFSSSGDFNQKKHIAFCRPSMFNWLNDSSTFMFHINSFWVEVTCHNQIWTMLICFCQRAGPQTNIGFYHCFFFLSQFLSPGGVFFIIPDYISFYLLFLFLVSIIILLLINFVKLLWNHLLCKHCVNNQIEIIE